jgi:hypothetical protein
MSCLLSAPPGLLLAQLFIDHTTSNNCHHMQYLVAMIARQLLGCNCLFVFRFLFQYVLLVTQLLACVTTHNLQSESVILLFEIIHLSLSCITMLLLSIHVRPYLSMLILLLKMHGAH